MSVIEVAIGPGAKANTFTVRVLSSPAGESSAVTALDAEALLSRRAELQQAVLLSATARRKVLSRSEQCVREVGQSLFTALLGAGEVAGRYRASAALAAERGEGLRVVLRIEDPVLAALPWEAMYDESTGEYVCRRDQLVRHVAVTSAVAPLLVDPPLRILGVVAAPEGMPALDVRGEQKLLQQALARLAGEGLAEIVWAPSAGWADLQDILLGGTWHVVHFIGHGDFDPERDEGVLALVDDDGQADLVEASRLVDLLRQARPMPRLVVLNSCAGATAGGTDLFSGTAAALVRGGVTAVAAMQYEITDPAATAFARGFYGAIAQGRGVDEAVSSGRVAILGLSGQTLEWMTPVLYLRGPDSHLFTLPSSLTAIDRDQRRAGNGGPRSGTLLHARAEDAAKPDGPPPGHLPSRSQKRLKGHSSWVLAVAYSPDGGWLASGGNDGIVQLWEAANGAKGRKFENHYAVSGVAFSPDGRLLAFAAVQVYLYEVTTGERVRVLDPGAAYALAVAFSPDGRLLAVSGDDGTVRIREVSTGAEVHTLTGHAGEVQGLAFSPDGRFLASAGDEGTVRVREVTTAAEVHTLTGHAGYALTVAFSPDGRLLASAGEDMTVRLWDAAAGAEIRSLVGHTGWVRRVAFSPDGRLLASASEDMTIRLWDVAGGAQLEALPGHSDFVRDVTFSPDGRRLASAADDRTVRIWS